MKAIWIANHREEPDLTVGKIYDVVVDGEFYIIPCDDLGERDVHLSGSFITLKEHREKILKKILKK